MISLLLSLSLLLQDTVSSAWQHAGFAEMQNHKIMQKRQLPKKSGDTIVFRRYARLATVPVPLLDGVTPPGAALSATDIKARIDFYGERIAVVKPSLIDLDAYVMQEAA